MCQKMFHQIEIQYIIYIECRKNHRSLAHGQFTQAEYNQSIVDLITSNWTELKLPWKPKDKELVWAWDDYDDCRRIATFYSKNNCSFSYRGTRNGYKFDNYAPFDGEYPQWAKEALNKLEELSTTHELKTRGLAKAQVDQPKHFGATLGENIQAPRNVCSSSLLCGQ